MNFSTDQVVRVVNVNGAVSGFVARFEDFLRMNMIIPVMPAQCGRGRGDLEFYKAAFTLSAMSLIDDWLRKQQQAEVAVATGVGA